MKMNNYNAVGIAEGFIECNNEKTIIKAWQYLIDTGLAFIIVFSLLHSIKPSAIPTAL